MKNDKLILSKILLQSGALLLIAISIPLLSLILPWRPQTETMATWFQRSGSIMVAFSIFAEFRLMGIYTDIFSGISTITHGYSVSEKALNLYKVMSFSAFLFAFLGTLIWGYGDIIFT